MRVRALLNKNKYTRSFIFLVIVYNPVFDDNVGLPSEKLSISLFFHQAASMYCTCIEGTRSVARFYLLSNGKHDRLRVTRPTCRYDQEHFNNVLCCSCLPVRHHVETYVSPKQLGASSIGPRGDQAIWKDSELCMRHCMKCTLYIIYKVIQLGQKAS